MNSSASREPVIAFEGVRIGFDEGEVLHGVTFHVAAGETKVLVGETGSGKTLLLKLAAGLMRPDAGRVIVLGQEVSAMSEDALLDFRRQIGFVFQEGALFDSLTVEENVAYRLMEEGVDADEIAQRVREALRFVELEHTVDKLPGELSGGMRRRVSIARALISKPGIVLYDSPTAGLDPVTAQTIITLILRLRDTLGVTSLLATHRLQDAFALANYRFDAESGRVIPVAQNGASAAPPTGYVVLRDGAVYFEGDHRAIADTQDAYVQKFLV
ncbi:MAG TPA: ATP-binding cassette domain-containing protein [Candidatus Acidoferrales bacterium]|jgi:phospholipid/cholesterol/gamma-HCH transport system ATP-binding protein|nr:ATP-binding cassette domain-containing protein [Candidatus Acidoferrales bacterium]